MEANAERNPGVTPTENKKGLASLQGLVFCGSPTWTRTRDLRINSPSLYQLSYQGSVQKISELKDEFAST